MPYPSAPSYQNHTAEFAYNVTPSDSVAGPCSWKYLYVGGAGSVALVDMGGNTVSLASVAAGTQLLLAGKRVNATGTSATNIVALV